jgi:membrane protease YdiL (CAAX protease family)
VSLSLTAWKEGAAGVRSLAGRVLIADVPLRYYAFAVFYLLTAKLTAAVLHRAMLGSWPAFGRDALLMMLPAILVSTPFQAGEEIGWRGYALPRLAARFGLARASLVLGVLWAFWHLPQFYIADADSYHQSFGVWAAQVVAMSVAFAWLYARTGGSLLLVMLLHAAINNSKDVVPSAAATAPGVFSLHASAMSWLTLGALWLCAGCLLRFSWPSDARVE